MANWIFWRKKEEVKEYSPYKSLILEKVWAYYKKDPKKPTLVIKLTPREISLIISDENFSVFGRHFIYFLALEQGTIKEYYLGGAKLVRKEIKNG